MISSMTHTGRALAALVVLALAPACRSSRVPDDAATAVISLQRIDCSECGTGSAAALEKHAGVHDAEFDLGKAELTVRYDPQLTSPPKLLAVVEGRGHQAVLGGGAGSYLAGPQFPAGLDVQQLARGGEDVDIEAHLVAGKVTVFDFFAPWCEPCRDVDAHMKRVLERHPDVALRKLDVVDWSTPLARRYLMDVTSLPYVVVYGTDGRRVGTVVGLHLDQLDAAIAKGRGS
jgi:thiol-disulfide isomerase/thioredoxin